MPRRADLVGQIFGKLKVIEKLNEKQDHYCVWLCQCECGNTTKVNTKQLNRGTITNCGCVPKIHAKQGSVAEDLTGRRFGKLRVLYRTENRDGRTCWMCQCDCGNRKPVKARDLKAGKVKSCGCGHHEKGTGIRDLRGRHFGSLTALYPTDRRDEKGSVYWHCRCACGRETEVTADGLAWGNYRSCGCRKEEAQEKISQQLTRIDGTCVEFLEHRKYRSDNKSGFRGVFRLKDGKFRVSIGFKGERYNLGTFDTFEKAVSARLEAEHLIHDGFLKAYYEWKKNAEGDPGWEEKNHLLFDVEKINGNLVIRK